MTKSNLYRGFSVQYVKTLINLAEKKGASRKELINALGINQDKLEQKSGIIPYQQVLDLFHFAMSLTNDQSLGIHLAQMIRPGSFGALGYTLMNCKNLRNLLKLTEEYGFLVSDIGVMSFEESDGIACVYWDTSAFPSEKMRPAHEAFIAGWYLYSKWLIGSDARLTEVWFSHSTSPNIDEYDDIFGCPIAFNQPSNALVFSAEYLDNPINHADSDLYEQMLKRTQLLAQRQSSRMDIHSQVILLIHQLLPSQKASLKNIATAINISERSLRRKLQDKGGSFQKILNEVRKDLAIQKLLDNSKSILEVALTLGYGDSSSFSSAFKTWYGISPSEYRHDTYNKQAQKTDM